MKCFIIIIEPFLFRRDLYGDNNIVVNVSSITVILFTEVSTQNVFSIVFAHIIKCVLS